jgi:hypothetical protein
MKVMISFDGREESFGSALLCHNERLADPLDEMARAVAEISKKRAKVEKDHLELARRQFLGGLYLGDNGPVVPASNLLRCLEDGARRIKRGKDINRGIVPLADSADLQYDGPRDPEELWKAGFWLRKGVGIGTKRVISTRPLFRNWQCELPIEVDSEIFDLHTLRQIGELAGKYAGLGDMRPIHGRCKITVTPLSEWIKMSDGATEAIKAALVSSIRRIRLEDEEHLANNA